MTDRNDRMVEFRIVIEGQRVASRGQEKPILTEVCLMRVSQMLCLFPDHRQIRTTESGWTVTVLDLDWQKVERAFRGAYLGMPVHVADFDIVDIESQHD